MRATVEKLCFDTDYFNSRDWYLDSDVYKNNRVLGIRDNPIGTSFWVCLENGDKGIIIRVWGCFKCRGSVS